MQQRSDILPRWSSAVDERSAAIRVLAVDYDGTIAEHGRVGAVTEATLRSVREADFRMILVSGRRLQNILPICGVLDLFDRVILENGAVSYCPQTGTDQLIAPAVNERFLADLERELPGAPLFIGRSMVATSARNAERIEMVIERGGFDLHVVGCGERVLVLPAGVDKGSGLSHALADLGLGRDRVVAVGDEENDIALFSGCALRAAVGTASPQLKAAADIVLPGGCEESMRRLADLLLAQVAPCHATA